MGATWKRVVTTKTQVDFEYEVPSVQSNGWGGDVSEFYIVLNAAKSAFKYMTGKEATSDNEIQLFVGDDKVVFRFWIEHKNDNPPTFTRTFAPRIREDGSAPPGDVRSFVESLPDKVLEELLAQATLEYNEREGKRDAEAKKLAVKHNDTPFDKDI